MISHIFEATDMLALIIRNSTASDDDKRRGLKVLRRNRLLWHHYLGHLVRSARQAAYIAVLREEVAANEHMAYCVCDYKMKVEPLLHDEDQRAHYGKRGISFHGIAMLYRGNWHYFAHFVEGSNTQDVGMTISIIEAFLHLLREHEQFDSIERIVLQSDQARNYSGHSLLSCIANLNKVNHELKIRVPHIERLVHTEVQEGHGECDRFFATAGRVLRRGVDNGVDLTTATDGVKILQDAVRGGSLANTSVERVELDVKRMGGLVKACKISLQGTAMEAVFLDEKDHFAFGTRICYGDAMEYVEILRSKGKKTAPAMPEPVLRRNFLPFSGACRSMFLPMMPVERIAADPKKRVAKVEHLRRKDLYSYCVQVGVERILGGCKTTNTITRDNCHDMLARIPWSGENAPSVLAATVSNDPCEEDEDECVEEVSESDVIEEDEFVGEVGDSDTIDEDECMENADNTATMPKLQEHDSVEEDTWLSFASRRFGPGWARKNRVRRCTSTISEDKDALVSIDPAIRAALSEFYEEGLRGPRVDPGVAVARLQENFRSFELPSVTQVHALMAQIHASGKNRKRGRTMAAPSGEFSVSDANSSTFPFDTQICE
jgi:hypothetical protein